MRGLGQLHRHCLTLDLKNDPKLIAEYRAHHDKMWPEVIRSFRDAGIEALEIYLLGTRLFMILETVEGFSFDAKLKADGENPKVREWEELMWKYQQALPLSKPGEKWRPMECIFRFSSK
jgi:L-rhamnose mutarotase